MNSIFEQNTRRLIIFKILNYYFANMLNLYYFRVKTRGNHIFNSGTAKQSAKVAEVNGKIKNNWNRNDCCNE